MEHTISRHEALHDDAPAREPIMRPFETVAIACGVATLIGTFAVSHVLLKGVLIGGSLLALMGSLLYFGLVGARSVMDDTHHR